MALFFSTFWHFKLVELNVKNYIKNRIKCISLINNSQLGIQRKRTKEYKHDFLIRWINDIENNII